MSLRDVLFGKPLASHEEGEQRVGALAGIPMLGLDALGSAAYGPEAAMTLLIPLGAVGINYITPISAIIIGLLLLVYLSYRQTIGAYPTGGGSYTVARRNLGVFPGLLAAAALLLDYVLVVAVGISAGVGALVSAAPNLQPYTLPLCLGILIMIAIVNLRGVRESGVAFILPTYLFVGCLFAVLAIGIVKTLLGHGHPVPVVAPPALPVATEAASLWLLLRAFASGCTAMTGVEAVSNGVGAFRAPAVNNARRTLTLIIGILILLLAGIAYLARVYHIGATEPGAAGYQSILSQLVAAIVGTGVFYYICIGAILSVLALSANTGFADFPATLPRHRAKRFPAAHLRFAWTTPRLFAGHLRLDGALRNFAHHLRRHHRPLDSAFCHRSFPRLHTLAGRHGGTLAARRWPQQSAQHDRQRCRRAGDGRDARCRPRGEICRRRVGDVAIDSGAADCFRRGASALSYRRARHRKSALARRFQSPAAGHHRPDERVEQDVAERLALRLESFAGHLRSADSRRR